VIPSTNVEEEFDPYAILGVTPDAGLEEIRTAFHRAVLLYHPDRRPEEPEEAMRRFGRLVVAYRWLRQQLSEAGPRPKAERPTSVRFEPSDFAWMSANWENIHREAADPDKLEWVPQVVHEPVQEPAVNETLVFVIFWVVATLLALPVGVLLAAPLRVVVPALVADGSTLGPLGSTLLVTTIIGSYVGMVALVLSAIVSSRKPGWLMRIIGFRRQHSLPWPKARTKKLPPQDEPGGPAGRFG